MAEHIGKAHGVHLGEKDADIIVFETNTMIYVEFTPLFLERADPSCLGILRFKERHKTFDRNGYFNFLDQLHAYLVMTPLKDVPADGEDSGATKP